MTKQLSVRLDPELRGELERAAAAERRPIGNLVRCILADWQAQRVGREGDDRRAA